MSAFGIKNNTKVVEVFDKPVADPYKKFLVSQNVQVRGTGDTPGEKIVKAAQLRMQRGEDPVMALFTVMVVYGNENGWKWIPKGSGVHEVLLDGVATGGECAAFAKALHMLATAPAKYGLGLGMSPELITVLPAYTGQHGKGFVSANNRGRVTMIDDGFVSNVFKADDSATDLMVWDNHKVVLYNGSIFDPSYGQIYRAPDTLVQYHITHRDVIIEGATYCRAVSRDGTRKVLFREDGDLTRVIGNTPMCVATKWRGPLDDRT